jgi:hypothetical protein
MAVDSPGRTFDCDLSVCAYRHAPSTSVGRKADKGTVRPERFGEPRAESAVVDQTASAAS